MLIVEMLTASLSWFILAEFVIFCILVATIEHESLVGSFLTIGGAIAAFIVLSDRDPVQWVINNQLLTVIIAISYFIIGAGYSLMKWFFYMNSESVIKQIKTSFLDFCDHEKASYKSKYRENATGRSASYINNDDPELQKYMNTFVTPTIDDFKKSSYNKFIASKNKNKIMIWMMFWIPSLFWTLTHDLIKSIWDKIYNLFSNMYQSISSKSIDKSLS